MKQAVEKRKPSGFVDHIALALTTFGVGYLPGPTGTYGSAIAVAIYVVIGWFETDAAAHNALNGQLVIALHWTMNAVLLTVFCLIGIWASGRTISIFGREDPSQAVVDEVMGQLITFAFIPFGLGWPFILAGFLLFRLFDIWKPFPVRTLETLPGGLGICVLASVSRSDMQFIWRYDLSRLTRRFAG
jgi:phosphatidylglycerophosphatase A